jgi:transposase
MPLKKVVIFCMLAGMFIPFILLTDIYPFFRFGMFAEPVRQAIQMEQFAIRYLDKKQQKHLLNLAEVGLSSATYLMRNYFYRNQSEELLKNIHQIFPQSEQVFEWQLLRITSPIGLLNQADTTQVSVFRPAIHL